jgi:hypothetical protein
MSINLQDLKGRGVKIETTHKKSAFMFVAGNNIDHIGQRQQ